MGKSTEPKTDGDKQKNTLDIGLLEEDDEFEEFPVEGKCLYLIATCKSTWNNLRICLFWILEWTSQDEEDKEANVWEDNWDDDNVEDDFSVQLR